MADPTGITDVFGNLGNIGGLFGNFNIADIPSSLNSWASHITTMGQLDIIGLITLGLCVFNIGIAFVGIINAMAARRRKY